MIGLDPVFKVIQDPFHERQILNAGAQLDRAAALLTGFDVDIEHAQGRWAQVIARDGIYAGFAGAKTHHGGAALGGGPGLVWQPFATAHKRLLGANTS